MRTVQTLILIAALVEASAFVQAQAQQPSTPDSVNPKADILNGENKSKQAATKKSKAANSSAPVTAAVQGEADAPKPTPPKSKLEPDDNIYIETGYVDWGLSGNQSKFRQYATPPRGLFLRDFRFAPQLRSPSQNALFELRGIGQDDYLASARGTWEYGRTQASGFLSRSRFFDPSSGAIDQSTWQTESFRLKRAIRPDFSLSFNARSDSQQLNYQIPSPRLDQNTDYWEAIAGGKVGSGFARVSFSNLHYTDETQTLQNFGAQKIGLSYLWNPTKALGIELAGSHVIIQQPTMPSSHIDTMSLGGDMALGAMTDLTLILQHRQMGLKTVQNAYARNENTGSFSLSHHFNSWRAQLGLRLQSDERVNGTQTNVDVPKWSTLDARVSGKLGKLLKLTVRGYTQSLNTPPPSVLSDPRTLYWTNRNFLQARLEGGSTNVNGYLVYTYRVNRNSERSMDVTTEQVTLGSNWQISQNMNLFAEIHHENWTGRTDTVDLPALNNFLPDSDTGVVELFWSLGRRASISLNYTGFAAYNDNPLLLQNGNTRGSFVTLSTHYRFPAGYDLGLIVAPWTYRDAVASPLNYDTTAFMVTGSARF